MWITGRWGPIRSHQVGLVAPVGHRTRRLGRGSGAHRALPADRFRSDQVGVYLVQASMKPRAPNILHIYIKLVSCDICTTKDIFNAAALGSNPF